MKSKKNPIVIVDVLMRKNKYKGIIEKAEQISKMLNTQHETSSIEMMNIKNLFGPMPATCSDISPYTEFKYNIAEDGEDIKVIMMTQDRIEYLKKECTYLGSHYYIKQTEAFEKIPFCVSTFHLN
jgi:hypothetical protein